MKIAIDLRSLQSEQFTGVENYALNLTDNLLALDKRNQYSLFYNRFARWGKFTNVNFPHKVQNGKIGEFQFINSKTIKTRYPNRLLNLALMAKAVNLEKIVGEFDVLLMPNLNQFNIKTKARLALTVHDLSPVVAPEFYDVKRRFWHRLLNFKLAFERADVIFAVSEYTKMDLMRLFRVDEAKIKVVYPGMDHSAFLTNLPESGLRETRNIYGLPGDYVLFLNTIEPRKNLLNLLKAFESVELPVSLVIAGKWGWKNSALARTIRQSPKFSKIKYLGYLPEKHKPRVIKMARALIYPSFYEGFGFQPLEAFCLGVPVIASSVAAVPEITQDAALLVNPFNVADLTNALCQILSDETLRRQLIGRGLKRASEFSWNKAAQKTLDILNRL